MLNCLPWLLPTALKTSVSSWAWPPTTSTTQSALRLKMFSQTFSVWLHIGWHMNDYSADIWLWLWVLSTSMSTPVQEKYKRQNVSNLRFCFFRCFFLLCRSPIAAWKSKSHQSLLLKKGIICVLNFSPESCARIDYGLCQHHPCHVASVVNNICHICSWR